MTGSLLVNVSKYASSHQKSPFENFITEAFAWLLRQDEGIRLALDELLQEKARELKCPLVSLAESKDFDTQVNFDGKFPDMLWSSSCSPFRIIFEHKVWSELHEGQLHNYRQYAKKNYQDDFAIVLITAHAGQHRQNPDIALCWHEIAERIDNLSSEDNRQHWLRDEFIALLKSNGLGNKEPLNPLSLAYYHDVKAVDGLLYDIVRRNQNLVWPCQSEDCTVSFQSPAVLRNARGRYDEWGRIGLEFASGDEENDVSGWQPGIFCGFLIDAYDHNIYDIMKKGPIAALIISVDKPLHKAVSPCEHYQQLINSLELPSGWKFSDRNSIKTDSKMANPWHPLFIYRDAECLFEGSNTFEQQNQIFAEQMVELQRTLLSNDSFVAFCHEMQRLHKSKTLKADL